MKESQQAESFDSSQLSGLFAGRSEAVVYHTIAVVTAGAASIFVDTANFVQTMSDEEAEQLLNECRMSSSPDNEVAAKAK